MTRGIGVAHFPRRCQPRPAAGCLSPPICAALAVLAAACANPTTSGDTGVAPDGLIALVADGDRTTLVGWDGSGGEPIPIKLPKGNVVWIATGLQDVLAAVRDDGTSATSDPVHLGKSLAWRNVDAEGPERQDAGRPGLLRGLGTRRRPLRDARRRPPRGRGHPGRAHRPGPRDRLRDRSRSARRRRAAGLDRRRPAGGGDRRRGRPDRDDRRYDVPASRPRARAATASSRPRPTASASRRWPARAPRSSSATWPAGSPATDRRSPRSNRRTARRPRSPSPSTRPVSASRSPGPANDGSVTLAVHDGRSGWRRVSKPDIGSAKGAVVAWRR